MHLFHLKYFKPILISKNIRLVTPKNKLISADTCLCHIIKVKKNIFSCFITNQKSIVLTIVKKFQLTSKFLRWLDYNLIWIITKRSILFLFILIKYWRIKVFFVKLFLPYILLRHVIRIVFIILSIVLISLFIVDRLIILWSNRFFPKDYSLIITWRVLIICILFILITFIIFSFILWAFSII